MENCPDENDCGNKVKRCVLDAVAENGTDTIKIGVIVTVQVWGKSAGCLVGVGAAATAIGQACEQSKKQKKQ
jgi:hypothetical protein